MTSQKPIILAFTDDIRANTGVGIQARKFLTALAKKYAVHQIGVSSNVANLSPVEYQGVIIHPIREYKDKDQFMKVFATLNPDIVILFTDPRFFEQVFLIDNEIRTTAKLCLYHLWDNEPFPEYNNAWYAACDYLIMISKFSYELFKKAGKEVTWIPHGFDSAEFYPLPQKDKDANRKIFLSEVGMKDTNQFIIFWNNRNLHRKRAADVIYAFNEFNKVNPDSILLMNTDILDLDGTDLKKIVRKFAPNAPIVINIDTLSTEKMNLLYNLADVSLNISYAEGFGLSVGESWMAGTPVICTKTGGMVEQMPQMAIDKNFVLEPSVRNIHGLVNAPYVFWDYVSVDQVVDALTSMYVLKKYNPQEYERLSVEGMNHVRNNYDVKNTQNLWLDFIADILEKPSRFKEKEIITI